MTSRMDRKTDQLTIGDPVVHHVMRCRSDMVSDVGELESGLGS